MINLFQPQVGEDELAAIRSVFSSNWLGTGERVKDFERRFGEYVEQSASRLTAVTSCTEGLFQAVLALGLGRGDEVVLPSISFVGAAHAVRSSGARVVLCDVDPVTLNPGVEDVERVITSKTKAVLVLHDGGAPGAVAELSRLAAAKSILLIEDAAIALGSSAMGRACGTLGDVGVWSFDAMKMLTTGDGGMVWCKRDETAERLRLGVRLGVGSYGFDRRVGSSRWWEIDPPTIGRRARMNDIAAAVGLVQLKRLPDFLRRRHELASRYEAVLVDLPWMRLPRWPSSRAARTFFWIQTAPRVRDRLAAHLLEREVYTNFQYWPLHRMRMYASDRAFPGADRAAESTLLLPLHQGLSESDVDFVLDAIGGFAP